MCERQYRRCTLRCHAYKGRTRGGGEKSYGNRTLLFPLLSCKESHAYTHIVWHQEKKKKKEDMRTKGEEGSKCEISKPKFDLRESKTKLDQSDRDCVQRNGVMAEICKREGLEVEGS